ncbi:MAG: signal peptide peptidase SppA [Kiritimatiellae bacterium]|nr:signal peptide peptidase SppA [Kiritimatiellia bacterium]
MAIICALLVFSLLVGMAVFVGLAAKGTVARGAEGVDEYPRFTEIWSYGEGEVKAVRIPVFGIITREPEGGFFAEEFDRVENVLRQIRAAKNDEDVKGVILEVNSPGGELTATDEIYRELIEFKQSRKDRKVVVFVSDLAASGGYYVAMAGDWVIAEPTAIVGSIGVIMQTLNLKGLGEKIGVHDTTIKSGEHKDLLNPFRDATQEELAQLQGLIDAFYRHFFKVVLDGRKMEEEKLQPLADGRIVTAKAALDHGLIDQVGYWDDAIARTRKILRETEVMIVRYETPPQLFGWLSRVRAPLRLPTWTEAGIPRFMYLWRP